MQWLGLSYARRSRSKLGRPTRLLTSVSDVMAVSQKFSEHCIAWAMTHCRCSRIEATAFADWVMLQAANGRITPRTEFLACWAGWGEWCTELHRMVTA